MSHPFKFGYFNDHEDKEFFYNDIWCVEQYPQFERAVVAPSKNHIDLMLDIIKNFEPPYWCLYVLLVSRVGNEVGRYQCSHPKSYNELFDFVTKYKVYFETDGRHHIWLGSATSKQLLVYDHHNVIYIYDDIEKIKEYMKKVGFEEEDVQFPVPHTHMYNVENDEFEIDIMDYWEWMKFPLGELEE